MDAFENIVKQKIGAISALAVANIAHSTDHSNDWPFVTLSSFQQRSFTTRILADALFVSTLPLVSDEHRDAWENEYIVSSNANWIQEAIAYQLEAGIGEYVGRDDIHLGHEAQHDMRQTGRNQMHDTDDDHGSNHTIDMHGTDGDHGSNHTGGMHGTDGDHGSNHTIDMHGTDGDHGSNHTSGMHGTGYNHGSNHTNDMHGTDSDHGSTHTSGMHGTDVDHGSNHTSGGMQAPSESTFKPLLSRRIHRVDERGDPVPVSGPGPFLPYWQVSPLVKHVPLNQDLFHDTAKADLARLCISSMSVVFGRLETASPGTSTSLFYHHLISFAFGIDVMYQDDPISAIFIPMFDSFGDNRTTVGIMMALVHWGSFFRNVLPSSTAGGVVAVLENPCYGTYSYAIKGAEVHPLGPGVSSIVVHGCVQLAYSRIDSGST